MFLSARSGLVALVALAAAACSDFVPGKDARFACAADADCPDAWHCNARLELCVLDKQNDTVAPQAKDVSITPPNAKAGDDVVISFLASEPLGADPIVDVAGAAAAADADGTDAKALRYAFRYSVAGSEIDDGTEGDIDAHADLVDDAGNEGTVTLGQLHLDFAPPVVEPLALVLPAGKTAVSPDDVLAFNTVTESGATVVAAHIVDATGAVLGDATASTTAATGQTRIEGSASLAALALADGDEIAVDLVVADAVGNETAAGAVRSTSISVDALPPTGALSFIPALPITSSLDVVVHVDSADATLVCFRGDVVLDSACDADVDFAAIGTGDFTLALSPAEGAKVVEAVLRDGAFNTSTGISAEIAYVPSGVLRSQPVLVPPAGQIALKDGDAVSVAGSAQRNSTVESVVLLDADAQLAVVQALPASTVAVAADGTLSGTFVAPALPDGHQLVLEVIVSVGALSSAPENSRSAAVVVDDTPPQNVSVTVQEGSVVQFTAVHLQLAADGASEVLIDGDVEDASNIRVFVPLQSVLNVPLTLGDGSKNIQVRFRDGAHNETIASTAVTLNRTVPAVSPLLVSPHAGVAGVKANDQVTVDGSADSDVTRIVSATMIFVDGAGAPLAGAGCSVAVTGQVALGAGNPRRPVTGTLNVGVPCANAQGVVLQVIVATAAGVESLPGPSTSASLFVDVTAPTGTATLVADASLHSESGFTRSRTVSLQMSADDGGGPVFVTITGDVVGLPSTPLAVPASGSQLVDLQDVDGVRNVSVVFSDAVGNTRAPINAVITLDRVAPLALPLNKLRLREQSDAPNDPAQVASSNDRFFVSADDNAIVNGDRAFAYSDAALTQRLSFPLANPSSIDLPANAGSGFAEQEIANDGSNRVFLTAVDNAGNESAPTAVAVPVFTFVSLATPHNTSALSVGVTSSIALAAAPVLLVAGTAASCSGAGTSFTCAYAPIGTEPAGVDDAVVRVTGNAAAAAPGTSGTDARTMTFDFTPPQIDGAKIVVGESDPGTQDQVAGVAGAVSDRAGADDVLALGGISASVFTGANGTGTRFGPVAVQGDGSIDVVNAGNNAAATLFVRVTDAAGNAAEVAVANDVAPPVVSGLAANPSIARSGAAVTITFDVADAHDLRANPVVTVGGRAAALVTGDLGTSGGSRSFTYSFTPLAGTDTAGARTVSVTGVDGAGNASAAVTTTLTLDFTNPTVADVLPGVRATWNGQPSVNGTAADAGSSVALVEVTILDTTSNRFFDGAGFNAVTKTFVATSGTTTWALAGTPPYVEGHGYAVTFRSTDAAGNKSAEGGPLTWTHDGVAPDTTITSAAPGVTTSTSQAFTFTSNDGTAGFACALDGAAFSTCASPATLNNLTVGNHTLAVRAVDAAGNVDATPATQAWRVQSVFIDVSTETASSCAVAQDHSLWCWGKNEEFGPHFLFPTGFGIIASPRQVGTDTDWVQVSVSDDHQCAVKSDHRLFCWGNNAQGQLGQPGNPPVSSSTTPLLVVDPLAPADGWSKVATGGSDTCAVKADLKNVFCWGKNNSSECDNNGVAGKKTVPSSILQFTPPIADLQVSPTHACVLEGNGNIQCWGSNAHGELGSNNAIGVRRLFNPINITTTYEAFAVGNGYTLAVTQGQLFGTGDGSEGQLGNVTTTSVSDLTRIGTDADWTAVAASHTATGAFQGGEVQRHACGLRGTGRLFCFGTGRSGEAGRADANIHQTPSQIGTDTDWVQISAGSTGNIGRRSNGGTFYFGDNQFGVAGTGASGNLSAPTGASRSVLALQGGEKSACAVLANGTLQCTGENQFFQLGDNTDHNRASFTTIDTGYKDVASSFFTYCGLRSTGVLACWGLNGANALLSTPTVPTDVPGTHTFSTLAMSQTDTCGVAAGAEAGQVFCAGVHEDGTQTTSLVRVGTASNFTGVATTTFAVCALDAAGVVSCFGSNTVGQLGRGTITQSTEPLAPVIGGHVFTKLAGGGTSSQTYCAIDNASRLFCWGSNNIGQVGGGEGLPSAIATPTAVVGGFTWLDVSAGGVMTCGVRSDHALLCWGGENQQQVVGIQGVTTPTVVSAETSWASVRVADNNVSTVVCAKRVDGTGTCFGRGALGALGDGNGFFETPAPVVQP